MYHFRSFKLFVVVLVALVLATSAYAFAATNTVPDTKAGDGLGVVSGYAVTGIVYTLNATNPSTLDSVSFNMGAAAAQVKVQLVGATGSWYSCALSSGTTWSCNTTGLAVLNIDQLRVVGASN